MALPQLRVINPDGIPTMGPAAGVVRGSGAGDVRSWTEAMPTQEQLPR
jgi:hypothetical protein